ncbi:MAG: TetR/AcrR family transcriptional regulator [Pseudomonadota bacterium]
MNTRLSLLDSAEQAVRQRGYHGFSYADLSREIGIRKASIHHHFPTKADLGLALIERYTERFFEKLDQIQDKNKSAAEQMEAYLTLYRDALDNGEQVCLCVSLSAGRDHVSQDVLDQLDQFHRKSLRWLESVFEAADVDGSIQFLAGPEAEASAALALVEGAQLLARASKNLALFDQSTRALRARWA